MRGLTPSNSATPPRPDTRHCACRSAASTLARSRRRHSTFGSQTNDLVLQLRKAGITQVILAGMSANLCVESHMRDLIEQGFQVVVVPDATAAAKFPGYDGFEAAFVNYRMIARRRLEHGRDDAEVGGTQRGADHAVHVRVARALSVRDGAGCAHPLPGSRYDTYHFPAWWRTHVESSGAFNRASQHLIVVGRGQPLVWVVVCQDDSRSAFSKSGFDDSARVNGSARDCALFDCFNAVPQKAIAGIEKGNLEYLVRERSNSHAPEVGETCWIRERILPFASLFADVRSRLP